jgi:hypothetical protein
MTDKEAMKLALEALRMADELCRGHGVDFKEYGLEFDRDIQVKYKDAIAAIKEALAQPEQEPVPTLEDLEQEIYQNTRNFVSRDVMEWMLNRYYTHPPQRTEQRLTAKYSDIVSDGGFDPRNKFDAPPQRKPLTDAQIYEMYNEPRSDAEMLVFARAIEAAHGIKENT